MQTLCTLFVVLALLAYAAARRAQQQGKRSRLFWVLTAFFWALGFASKEDAVLLPAYTLAMELTIFRFVTLGTLPNRRLRGIYAALTASAALAWIFLVIPHYWHWDAYPGRDFSSPERLLSQSRVLTMYLGRILLPAPSLLPFYYDDFSPSRGLLEPVSTLPCALLITGLLATAWHLRDRRPLFALGIFLFFFAHLLTSNVIGLELAFEHRNHFALIGIVIALGDALHALVQRFRVRPRYVVAACGLLIAAEAGATIDRSIQWGDPMRLAEVSTRIAPNSARAWLELCGRNYELSGKRPDSVYLDRAIDACTNGGHIPYSAATLANVVLFKTIRGDVTEGDWAAYLSRLQAAPMSVENRYTVWVMLKNASAGVPLDENRMLQMVDIVAQRTGFDEMEYARIGYFVLEKTKQPDRAYPYFALAVEAAPRNSPLVAEILTDLRSSGRNAWVTKLQMLEQSKH